MSLINNAADNTADDTGQTSIIEWARPTTAEVVVSVGTDHHRFDRLIQWIDQWRDANPHVVVVVQAGTSAPSRHGDSRELIPHGDLLDLFQQASVVVSHGGPSTVMDARMSGRLPIVVPRNPAYEEHVDEHQMRFAQHLDRHDVAVVVHDREALFTAIDQARAQPEAFAVAVGSQTAAGVAEFGRAMDELLQITTALRPPLPAQDGIAPADADLNRPGDRSNDGIPPLRQPDRRREPTVTNSEPLVDRRKAVDSGDPELVAHLQDRSVTVVIATRDRPELLRRAINGVLAQRHDAKIEIVLVFDRSEPDRSLERSGSEDDGNGVVISVTTNQRSPGLAGARNSGIGEASNAWIAFCDDDDEWLPGKLQSQFAALDADHSARAACTGILIRYEGNDTERVPLADRLTFDGFLHDRMTEVHPSSWLIHKDTLVDLIGLVDEEIPGGYAEDYDMFLRTSRVTSIAVAAQPLVRVWWHGASFFFERWKMIDEALDYLVNKYPEFKHHPEGLARIRGQQAVAKAAMGNRRDALKAIVETARLKPTEKRLPLAIAVAAGLKAERALKIAHRFGKGI